VEILGMQVWPSMHWQGWFGTYGRCGIDPPTERGRALCNLAGSMSTWAVSILAIIVLSWKPWHGWKRAALLSVGIWWVDLLTYTLPTWGIPRSILWGGHYSEPYYAAKDLGVPGPLFQAFVLISSVVLAYFWLRRVRTYSAVWRLGNRSQP